MNKTNDTNEHIELYSGNRDRTLYQSPSSFTVPFSSTVTNLKSTPDSVLNGCVYYRFLYQPCQPQNIYELKYIGKLGSMTTLNTFYVLFFYDTSLYPGILTRGETPDLVNFFSGYIIQVEGSTDTRIVRSYDPSTGAITLNEPWTDTSVSPVNGVCIIYPNFPTYNSILIPARSLDGTVGFDYEGAYNGYYIIFESPYPAYSNSYNSNIFYRKISYYDNRNRTAYFDQPIPFDYRDSSGNYPVYIDPQMASLRKSLPLERWNLQNSYYNTIPPVNPLIGPLIGQVLVLPVGSSTEDNYYTGKYVYFYNNYYYGPYPSYILNKGSFIPSYGFYLIKAYNGSTRELSIDQDINNITCGENINIEYPKTQNDIINITTLSYNSYNPLDYIGTMTSMNQTVCYDISLSSLTLPNVDLSSGSKLSFYPYVYVELANVSSPDLASNQIIYSNNPNSNRALFVAPVNLLVDPNAGTFLTLYSNMVQTIKFKPNDSLRFSVYFPNGELFTPTVFDTIPPYEPDFKLQIEAVFKILRRVITSDR